MDTLGNEKEAEARIEALSLLPRFERMASTDRQKSLQLALKALGDETPAVRMSAAGALAALGEATAIKDLKSAIAREKDNAVRNVLRIKLSKLEEKANASKP